MEVWFNELQTPGMRLGLRVESVLHRVRSEYQEVAVYETMEFGRLLALDDVVMTTERDEFTYHEMLVHVPLASHPDPRRVLIVGGGDGGAVREVLRHASVEAVVLAELDAAVIDAARRFLPGISCGLDDPRVEIRVGDGVAYLAEAPAGSFDAVIVDAPDPVGPATGLFSREFYASARRALRPGGVFSAQSESPLLHAELIGRMQRDLRSVFPLARLYWSIVPTYPGGMWGYAFASLGPDPLAEKPRAVPGTRWWTPELHRAAFLLPPCVAAGLE